MLGVTLADWLVIVIYLLGITAIGVWAARRVTSTASFFISDRKFGKLMMMFFNFGTGSSSSDALSVAAKTYRVGASGIWYQWLWLFITPLFWVIAPLFRRMRAVTTGDYFEARFDRSVAVLFAVVGMLNLMVNIGLMLYVSGAMITAVSGGAINPNYAILAMTVMFVIYGVAGGLTAAIVTDLVQGLLTIVLSFLILPFALSAVGGMDGLSAAIDNPRMFSLASDEISFFFITVITINGVIGWAALPHSMGMCAAGKTETEARVGLTYGIVAKRICTVAWMLTGMCAVALYAGKEVDVDYVYGQMARDLLPAIAPGLVGLFIASMLATVMSCCDAFMVAAAALFTENIYRKLIFTSAGDRHYRFVGRCASVAVVIAAIFFAFTLQSAITGMEIFWKVSAMMGLAFWVGLFWRRATAAGAWAGTLVSFAAFLFTSQVCLLDHVLWDFNEHFADKLPEALLWQDGLYLPWQMIFYLTAGLVAMVVVSLMTRPVSEEKLDRFYACLRTPVGPDEPETEPFTLPPGLQPAPRRVLIDLPGFEIPVPSVIGILGVLAASLVVAALIGSVYWILGLAA